MHRSIAGLLLLLSSGCAAPSALREVDGRAVVEQSTLREGPDGRFLSLRLASRGAFSAVRQAVVVKEVASDGSRREVARGRLELEPSGRPANRRARKATAIVSLPEGVDARALELELVAGR